MTLIGYHTAMKHRRALMILLVCTVPVMACVQSEWNAQLRTGSLITPDVFQFAEVVPATKDGGGWRAVCVKAQTGQRIANPQGPHIDTAVICDLEVGTPIRNRLQGYIPLAEAQRISAEVANQAAYKVLQHSHGVTSTACKQIRDVMNIYLGHRINGSAVTKCGVTRWKRPVPVVHWPAPGASPGTKP